MSPTRARPPKDSLRWLRIVILAGMVVNLVGTGVFVVTSSNARQANCDRVSTAFETYTEALLHASEATEPRSPEEQARFEGRVALFLQDIDPILQDCS